jgi:orotidine-5'-phosphate decarboxylase
MDHPSLLPTIAPDASSALNDARLAAARERLAVALDFPSAALALGFVDRLEGSCLWLKVGLELYLASGNGLIETLRGRGFEIFLDLKLHDIPNTVAGAVRAISSQGAGMGVSLLTIHAGGGEAMMRAAAEAAAVPGGPKLLAVTVLTSMDAAELTGVGVSAAPAEQVLRLGRLAQAAGGADMGLVCSAEEVRVLRAELGPEIRLVTPGIRPAGAAVGDQRRVATPASAIRDGASMLVVGRPITQAADPVGVVRGILEEIAGA